MTHKPYSTHTQNTHDKGRNTRSKFIETHWKAHKHDTQAVHETHAQNTHIRNAETHTTGSQQSNENTPQKIHKHTASS